METLSHAFRDCPIVRPAVEWLRMLWQRFKGLDAVPELSIEALVADCDPAWQFPGDDVAQDMWTTLRLAFLYATWVARCQSQHGYGTRVQPVNVVATAVAMVKHVIRLDWVTTTLDACSSMSVCSTWFRGRRPPGLTREPFQARWCNGGLLAMVTAQGKLRVTLSVFFDEEGSITRTKPLRVQPQTAVGNRIKQGATRSRILAERSHR